MGALLFLIIGVTFDIPAIYWVCWGFYIVIHIVRLAAIWRN